jgi:hypothetical protein
MQSQTNNNAVRHTRVSISDKYIRRAIALLTIVFSASLAALVVLTDPCYADGKGSEGYQCSAQLHPGMVVENDVDENQPWNDSRSQVNKREEADKSEWKVADYIASISAAIAFMILLVTAGGVWVGLGTLKTIERQTKAAQDAANAAFLNAQAVIHSERPWILVPVKEGMPDIEPPVLVERAPGTLSASYSKCIMKLQNFGTSPARITYLKVFLTTVSDERICPNFQDYEAYEGLKMEHTVPQNVILPTYAFAEWADGKLTPEEIKAIENSTKFLWVIGQLKYKDTFERPLSPVYESNFCYRWSPTSYFIAQPYWQMGPWENNKAS